MCERSIRPRTRVPALPLTVAGLVALAGHVAPIALAGAAPDARSQPGGGGTPAAGVAAAPAPRDAAGLSNAQLLRDFIHYVKIDQGELALSYAKALLERKISQAEFLGIVEDTPQVAGRFDEAIRDAMRNPALEGVAADLFQMYEGGRRERARDPKEITRNIGLLDQTQRARLLARERLMSAGEYAVPQLLDAVTKGDRAVTQAQSQDLLAAMGADAVMPLCAALTKVEPALQERLARVIGQMGQSQAIPYLADTAAGTKSDAVRGACLAAMARIDSRIDASLSPAFLYVALGEQYAAEPSNLTRFPGEPHQLLWTYEPGVGLFATPIRTEVFNEAMAMRLAERALTLDPQAPNAAPLWLAANFNRQLQSPKDYENPAYGKDRREAMYYAVAAGPRAVDAVLARAMRDRNTPLARLAIEALSRTAGGTTAATAGAEPTALVRALTYPDRRVQIDAALALAGARPAEGFPGADRVAPVLAGAVRDAGARFALAISGDLSRQQELSKRLQALGYTVLPPAASLAAAADSVAEAPGVDLIVSDLPRGQTESLIEEARGSARLGATPVLALLSSESYSAMLSKHENDPMVRVAREGVTPEQFAEASRVLVQRASGAAMTPEESQAYSLRAIAALREMAIGGSAAFDINDALRPLMAAIDSSRGEVRLQTADVLAHMRLPEAQSKVMDAAAGTGGAERIALMDIVGGSARRFGNMLPERLVSRVVELASSQDPAEATAAAALMGALNLPGSRLTPLIVGEPQPAKTAR